MPKLAMPEELNLSHRYSYLNHKKAQLEYYKCLENIVHRRIFHRDNSAHLQISDKQKMEQCYLG